MAIGGQDPAKVRIFAHSLKGAIDNFAAQAAYDAALRLEMLGRGGNLAEAEQACAGLQKEMDRLLPVVANLVSQSADRSGYGP